MAFRTSVFVVIGVVSVLPVAAAQPSADPGAPAAPSSRAAPDDAADAAPPRWAFGFRLSTGGLGDDLGNDADVTGYGVFGRVRINPRWGVELDLGKAVADLGNNRERALRAVTVNVLFHVFEFHKLEGHVRAGVGKANETYTSAVASVEFEDTMLHAGVGLEYPLRRDIAISAHANLFRWSRASRGTSPTVISTGGLLGLGVAYRF